MIRLIAFLAVLALAGCANPTTNSITDAEVKSVNSNANTQRIKANIAGDGGMTPQIETISTTAPTTSFVADAAGLWGGTTGQGALANLNGLGQVFSSGNIAGKKASLWQWSEQTQKFEKVAYVEEFSVNHSDQSGQWADQVGVVMEAVKGMTQIEATRYVEANAAAMGLGSEAIELLTRFYIPTLPTE